MSSSSSKGTLKNPQLTYSTEEAAVIDWLWVAKEAAGGIIGAVAGEVFLTIAKSALGQNINYKALLKDAVDDICARVGKMLKDEFIREYVADADTARNNLLTYMDSKKLDKLTLTEDAASYIVGRLKSVSETQEGLGGFMVAANIHLTSLKLMIEHNADFTKTLERNCLEYADWGEEQANKMVERVKTSVSPCTGGCRTIRDMGEVCSYSFTFDYGKDRRRFSTGSRNEMKRECDEARAIYYNDRVNPAEKLRDEIIHICNLWRSFNTV
ncbi:hypothetical protein AWH48_11675 [Domibacillus aminovorans]|uniref:Uncharacterized protein n=2 Tax=Domibacillus aminovorans TaxID=29332 RepID=A0A177KKI7_9BACI|nr:hypothetical protein AWH48_11675 [Domibacillus aminovorans]